MTFLFLVFTWVLFGNLMGWGIIIMLRLKLFWMVQTAKLSILIVVSSKFTEELFI